MQHKAVLVQEVLQYLALKPNAVVVDGTVGAGGHAEQILQRLGSDGRYIGFDQDLEAAEWCKKKFQGDPRVVIIHENFRQSANVLEEMHLSRVNAILLDVGVSSQQIDQDQRGFSFQKQGPLDMRMNQKNPLSAFEIVNHWSEQELAKIFIEYGEERRGLGWAKKIVEARRHKEIQTTSELSDLILKAYLPQEKKKENLVKPGWMKKHPATRIFQALRIAVNDELHALKDGLNSLWGRLSRGGRMVVISFHSLEDRIVKHQFQAWAKEGQGLLVTRKPVTASDEEMKHNVRARSAKLRTLEKIL